ncbi:sensor histidine kinase [Nocardia alba]|uniref:Two-component system sensor histidine kinase DesK n=1 Tax=Nocardia alba TaxID=225051 RepID=A0A4R1FQR4_9NOCA|nr:histidine kinase [Nocardia alba]TCJ93521.1 two-component system sensor histidine kinase DesK [Nocardia alba]
MRATAWWHELSGAAKFRLYSRVTFQAAVAVLVVALAIAADSVWSVLAIVIGGIAAMGAVEAQPDLGTVPGVVARPWALPVAAATLVALWMTSGIVVRLANEAATVDGARVVGISAAFLALFSVIPFARRKWWILFGLSAATPLVVGAESLGAGLQAAVRLLLAGVFAIVLTWLTVWGLGVVDELERAKGVEARLQVAEERLRFSRDLHDVVGRGFSAIAVKSELAVALSRAGDADRAVAEMNEVRTLAVESMAQMRTLVRAYRNIDLRAEVAGARSLLSAAGCELVVEGDAAKVPTAFHEVAAWVVREGTTNIVEHSAATMATLTLGGAGMSLRNDRPQGAIGERSGLRGLGERLAAVGATSTSPPPATSSSSKSIGRISDSRIPRRRRNPHPRRRGDDARPGARSRGRRPRRLRR